MMFGCSFLPGVEERINRSSWQMDKAASALRFFAQQNRHPNLGKEGRARVLPRSDFKPVAGRCFIERKSTASVLGLR